VVPVVSTVIPLTDNQSLLHARDNLRDSVLADSETWWSQIDAKLLAEYGVSYRGECHQNVAGGER
jgi:hypothetical protein